MARRRKKCFRFTTPSIWLEHQLRNGGVGMDNEDDIMLGLILGVLIFLTIVVSAIVIKIGV